MVTLFYPQKGVIHRKRTAKSIVLQMDGSFCQDDLFV